jgi:hypothetical protein
MWHDPGHRRINLAASLAFAKKVFSALVIENTALREDLARARLARDEAISLLRELQAAVQARWAAEQRLADLYRERAIQRAQKAERDPNAALN